MQTRQPVCWSKSSGRTICQWLNLLYIYRVYKIQFSLHFSRGLFVSSDPLTQAHKLFVQTLFCKIYYCYSPYLFWETSVYIQLHQNKNNCSLYAIVMDKLLNCSLIAKSFLIHNSSHMALKLALKGYIFYNNATILHCRSLPTTMLK